MTHPLESERLRVDCYDGKYTVIQNKDGGVHALRYGEPWRDCVGDGLILALAQDLAEARLAAAPSSGLAVREAWHAGEELPSIESGTSRQYIVAVYRNHSGKIYSFAAEFLNGYWLQYDDCPKGMDRLCDECEDGCLTTGWFSVEGADDDGSTYHSLGLKDGDRLEGWREIPRWEDRAAIDALVPGERVNLTREDALSLVDRIQGQNWKLGGVLAMFREEAADLITAALAPQNAGGESNADDLALAAKCAGELCDDCPPVGYETDRTRCLPCPRRTSPSEATPAPADPLNWELSDDTKQRIAEMDDNIRNAAINAGNIVAGSPAPVIGGTAFCGHGVMAAICETCHPAPAEDAAVATKKVYIKPLRAIVEVQAVYADQIRDLLNNRPAKAVDVEAIQRIIVNYIEVDIDYDTGTAGITAGPAARMIAALLRDSNASSDKGGR